MSLTKVSRKELKRMSVGETCLFREVQPTSKSAGKMTQGYACSIGLNVKTRKCLVVIPTQEDMLVGVLVTLLGEKEGWKDGNQLEVN